MNLVIRELGHPELLTHEVRPFKHQASRHPHFSNPLLKWQRGILLVASRLTEGVPHVVVKLEQHKRDELSPQNVNKVVMVGVERCPGYPQHVKTCKLPAAVRHPAAVKEDNEGEGGVERGERAVRTGRVPVDLPEERQVDHGVYTLEPRLVKRPADHLARF